MGQSQCVLKISEGAMQACLGSQWAPPSLGGYHPETHLFLEICSICAAHFCDGAQPMQSYEICEFSRHVR